MNTYEIPPNRTLPLAEVDALWLEYLKASDYFESLKKQKCTWQEYSDAHRKQRELYVKWREA
jgi:hypothetical protein